MPSVPSVSLISTGSISCEPALRPLIKKRCGSRPLSDGQDCATQFRLLQLQCTRSRARSWISSFSKSWALCQTLASFFYLIQHVGLYLRAPDPHERGREHVVQLFLLLHHEHGLRIVEVMGTASNVCVFFDLGVWVFACALLIFMYPVMSMADNCFAFDFVITQFKNI